MAKGRADLIADLFLQSRLRDHGGTGLILMRLAWPQMSAAMAQANRLAEPAKAIALSNFLFESLKEPISRYLPGEEEYSDAFDRFEYTRSLVFAHLFRKANPQVGHFSGPPGRFALGYMWPNDDSVMRRLDEEIAVEGEQLPLIQAGLFDGSLEELKQVKSGFDKALSKREWLF